MRYYQPRYNNTMGGYYMLWDHLDDRSKYILKTIGGGIPIIGGAVRSVDNITYMDDYLRNRGMSYSQVKYATRTPGAQSFGGSLNFVSKNLGKLYR